MRLTVGVENFSNRCLDIVSTSCRIPSSTERRKSADRAAGRATPSRAHGRSGEANWFSFIVVTEPPLPCRGSGGCRLLLGMAHAGLGRLRRFAVVDPALIAKVASFLGLALAFRRLAVLVHLFLDEPCAFLNFALSHSCRSPDVIIRGGPREKTQLMGGPNDPSWNRHLNSRATEICGTISHSRKGLDGMR
jgi:hypothetical protein